MSKFFINHPIPAIVLALILTLVGALAAMRLPIAEYPDITPPTVFVDTNYIGADASVVNNTVAQIIEDSVSGAGNIEYMSSTIDTNGNYELTVVFKQGTDIDNAAVSVQNKVSDIISDLPDKVQSQGVTVSKSTPDSVFMFSLISPKGSYDGVFMKNYATIYLIDKLTRVNGVGKVTSYDGDYSMRIWLNPDKLAELGLAISDVETAIKEQNVQAAVGSLGKMPVPSTQENEFVGRSTNRKETPADFENIILKTTDGSFVRMKDFARVEVGARNMDMVSFQNGHEMATFSIQLTNDANTLETIAQVKKILTESEKDFPPDMEYVTLLDATRFINQSLSEISKTFFEALLLVVIIVWLFLKDFRATIIALLAIPVSIVATFAVFPIIGFSINTLTLFALILAIGLVVDDAIVVIEIVEKNLERGMEIKEATLKAMQEIQAPIIAIACVLAAVFIPAAFLEGITGELYRQFALTIVVSMFFSMIVALSFTPALCVLIFRRQEKKSSTIFDRFQGGFKNLLEIFMSRKIFAVFTLVAVMVGTFCLNKILPGEYIPDEDKGTFIAAVNLPEGASMNRTIETLNKFSAALEKVDALENTVCVAGINALGDGLISNSGAVFGILKDWSEREETLDDVLNIVENMAADTIPEAEVFLVGSNSLPGMETEGAISMRLLDVQNHSDEELADLANKIETAASKRDEFEDITKNFNVSKPYVDIRVDEDKVKFLGVNLDDVYSALRVNLSGDEINDFTRFGHVYKVVLQADSSYRDSFDSARFIFVRNENGGLVPLDSLVTLTKTTGVSQISRYNGVRCVNFDGNVGEGFSTGQALDALEEVVEEVAPDTFQIEWSGQSRQEKLAQSSVVEILALALLFAFLCLVALYESWKIPFAVMLSVPTGIFGALLAEIVTENLASVYMHIGILVLIGLAAKNAILIVEFAKIKVENGEKPARAAVNAAVERLRPVLMTSLAFVMACIPLAVASGAGSAARNGMGAAIVGGMVFATVLGVFIVPILFTLIERRTNE